MFDIVDVKPEPRESTLLATEYSTICGGAAFILEREGIGWGKGYFNTA